MVDVYVLFVFILTILAIIDLVVGVSNDAVNFLNSAIGSKAVSLRTILIVASFGIFIGTLFSSGMMEVARNGIFIPGQFYFNEIIIIFLAVMITDVILLDMFNSMGLPTSTTVSIVFELLGAALSMSLIKITNNRNETISDIGNYINSEKAFMIISGILLSVVVAFSIGVIVQYISRLIFSFHYEQRMKYFGVIFSGTALTAITYFIFMKGLKGTPFYEDLKSFIEGNEMYIILGSFLLWTVFSHVYMKFLKKNILVMVIIIGTFGLALSFAGNDLVNFIGVPMAAFHSYEAWTASNEAANSYLMIDLANKVPTEPLLLFAAGAIMVVTLWFSNKARTVAQTEIGLARQGDGYEKFQPNFLSRLIVRGSAKLSKILRSILPEAIKTRIDIQFVKPVIKLPKNITYEIPAFDMIRASVNLMVAGILIAIATSYQLPLSTTYVTFMVAMGTSLADRAWDRESAVYRVAGVLNVILGWFSTALIAFVTAGTFAFLIHLGGRTVIAVLLIIVGVLLVRGFRKHKEKFREQRINRIKRREAIKTINEVVNESSAHILEVIKRVRKLFNNVVEDLSSHNLNKLKKTEKHVKKLNDEVNELRDEVFYFIKSLDESSVEASRFYILVLSYIQDIAQSIEYISSSSFNHVNNVHKNLKKHQIEDLYTINVNLGKLLNLTEQFFNDKSFNQLRLLLHVKQKLLKHVSSSIDTQIDKIRTEQSSPKNTKLYFGILLETKDLISTFMNLLELYQEFYLKENRSRKNLKFRAKVS